MRRVQVMIAKPKIDEQEIRAITECLLADDGGAIDAVPNILRQNRTLALDSAAEIGLERLCSTPIQCRLPRLVHWSKHRGACMRSLCVDAEDVRQVFRRMIRAQRSYFANALAKLFIWLQRRSALMF